LTSVCFCGSICEAIPYQLINPVFSSLDGVLFDKNRTSLIYYPGGRAGSYTIPGGVTQIPSYAFQACPYLTALTVPNSVVTIGSLAFNVDPSLTAVYFQGNAPTVASFGFEIQTTVIVYYLPGTSGWGSSLGGLWTALWPLQIRTDDGNFGVRSNQFGFNIICSTGVVVAVDACTNPANPLWIPVQTNTVSGGFSYFSDPQWTNYPTRLYRLRLP
jgi:hypothetical protein